MFRGHVFLYNFLLEYHNFSLQRTRHFFWEQVASAHFDTGQIESYDQYKCIQQMVVSTIPRRYPKQGGQTQAGL